MEDTTIVVEQPDGNIELGTRNAPESISILENNPIINEVNHYAWMVLMKNILIFESLLLILFSFYNFTFLIFFPGIFSGLRGFREDVQLARCMWYFQNSALFFLSTAGAVSLFPKTEYILLLCFSIYKLFKCIACFIYYLKYGYF
jgi:hypothetical protein